MKLDIPIADVLPQISSSLMNFFGSYIVDMNFSIVGGQTMHLIYMAQETGI
jgi:hypothetical protein